MLGREWSNATPLAGTNPPPNAPNLSSHTVCVLGRVSEVRLAEQREAIFPILPPQPPNQVNASTEVGTIDLDLADLEALHLMEDLDMRKRVADVRLIKRHYGDRQVGFRTNLGYRDG